MFGENAQAGSSRAYWRASVHHQAVDGHTLIDDTGDVHPSYDVTARTAVVACLDGYIERTADPDNLYDGSPLIVL
ncbi:MAG TPA: hypothetical protein VEF72_11360 [Mycobacterium sp.]|nr:hypothetical protein [Mycobacterium sp.]